MPTALEPPAPPVEHRPAAPDLRAVFEATCWQLGIDPVAVSSRCREQHVILARTRISQKLFSLGWSTAMLARVLPRGARTFQRVRARMIEAGNA